MHKICACVSTRGKVSADLAILILFDFQNNVCQIIIADIREWFLHEAKTLYSSINCFTTNIAQSALIPLFCY